jgi:dUTP pyrophosphatase
MSQAAISVKISRLAGNEDLPLPDYQTEGAVAMDLHAAVVRMLQIAPGEFALVPCGFAMALPVGYEGQIRPRSGLASKSGVTVLNSPGTIDPDYRGEVKVVLINHGKEPFNVERGARIAQMLILPAPHVTWEEVSELPETQRGGGGFGHTGR